MQWLVLRPQRDGAHSITDSARRLELPRRGVDAARVTAGAPSTYSGFYVTAVVSSLGT